MIETETMMKNTCWINEKKSINMHLNFKEFHLIIQKTGIQWRNIVKQYRQSLLNIKKVNYSMTTGELPKSNINFVEPLSVNLLSPEYFMHNYQMERLMIVK